MTTGAPPPPNPRSRVPAGRQRLLVAAAAAAVLVAVVVWLIVRDGDDDSSEPTVAVSVAVEDLVALSESVEHPVYWAGPRKDTTYELTRAAEGRIFIRYLPADVKVGDPRPNFLTVGTYPMSDGYERVQAVSEGQDATRRKLPNGGLAVAAGEDATSAYFAYPDGGYQVEIHDPVPGRALKLIVAGRIRPIR